MQLLEACEYRSKSKVNITNDKIRVKLIMSISEWRAFKKQYKIKFSNESSYS